MGTEAGLKKERIRLVERYMIDAEEAALRAAQEATVEVRTAEVDRDSDANEVAPARRLRLPPGLSALVHSVLAYIEMFAGDLERPDPADLAPALIALAFAIGIGVAVALTV